MESQKKSDDELIEKTANGLKKIKGIASVILFGSYARKEQKPISDIDICVVTGRKISDEIRADIASYASRKIQISIFWDLPPSVRFSVLKEGKVLFNRNERLMHVATVETVSEYLDFKPIIDRNVARVFGHE